jgi:uncharacterized protein YndB with AHSA1/START domain
MTADLQTIDGRPALRLERYLPHPVERVWRAVSEPAEVRRWMPAAADWTLTLGAEFELGGQPGQITELDPPHLIGWTFGADRFRCKLQAKGDGCALVFTHIFSDAAPAAQTAAGWECYLDRLDAQLAGQDLSEERAHQPVGERHERYAARFGLDPAAGRAFIATLGFRGPSLEDCPALRLERRYDQPVERVWRALTESDELSRWFPGEFEVSHSDPPHLLIGGWQGDGTLRFELQPYGAGCVLTFTHAFADRDQAALTGAGWDRCFARLDALLAGQTMTYEDSLAAWPQVHERLAAAWGIDPGIGRAVFAEHTAGERAKPLPDLESADSLGRFVRHADVLHHGEAGAMTRPFHQGVDRFRGPLEDGLDAAVGEVPHPPAHALALGRPTARVAERHPLHETRDQHPIANHADTVLRRKRRGADGPPCQSIRTRSLGSASASIRSGMLSASIR